MLYLNQIHHFSNTFVYFQLISFYYYLIHLPFLYSLGKKIKVNIIDVKTSSYIIQIIRKKQLDGYCEKLKIAFEYQGHPAHLDKNYKRYKSKSQLDILKKELCSDLGIILIQIPVIKEVENKWTPVYIMSVLILLIIKEFKDHNKNIPLMNNLDFNIDFFIINHGNEMLKKLRDFAKK